MSRTSEENARALSGVVASYVRANPQMTDLRAHLSDLYDYVRRRGLSSVPREELERTVVDHWNVLEGAAERARREAALFRPGRPVRPVRYRHGASFCPSCGFYKDYRKECPNCGYLELTR